MKDNKDKLTALAERLLEKEVIFKDDLVSILGDRPFEKKDEEPSSKPKKTTTTKKTTPKATPTKEA